MWRRGLLAVVGVASGLVLMTALAAANTVPASRAGRDLASVTPEGLKPVACAGITVTAVVAGTGTVTGGNPSELVVGGAGVDTMDGGKGDDCILGGGGNDSLRGSQGTDVCIGGPGTDTFHASCETQIQ